MKPLKQLKPLRSFWIKEALGLTLALESGKGLEARVRSILDASRSRELLTRRALVGIGLGTAASVSLVALMAPKRSLPGKGKPVQADAWEPNWPTEVRGHVVLPDGSPAVGATVWFQTRIRENYKITPLGYTDSMGRYQFPITDKGDQFAVQITKTGFGLAGTLKQEADLMLTTATSVTVQAVDETGKPLRNVEICLETLTTGHLGEPNFYVARFPLGSSKTNAEGIATLTELPPQAQIRLLVSDDHYCRATKLVAYDYHQGSVQATPMQVVFPHAVQVSGRVLFPDGTPRTRVRVDAQGMNNSAGWGTSLTDGHGNYTLRVPPGNYNIALDLEGTPDWTTRAHEGVAVRSGKNLTGIDFTLERGCLISGRVLGADDRPITGATVAVYGPAHPKSSAWVQTARTNARGHYTLHVPAGEQYLYLMSQPPLGYAPPQEVGRELTILRGLSRTEDFILPTTEILPPVTGTVRDASGAPVAGALLRVEGKEFEDSFAFQGLTTDATGRFTLPLRKRKPFTLAAERHGRYSEPLPITPGQELTLSLTKKPAVLMGAVVVPDGTPLAGIPVHLWRSLGGLGSSQPEGEAVTDATGHYRFAGLRPGERYWVEAGEWKRGPQPRENPQSATIKIPSDGTVTLKPITLWRGQ